MYFYSVGNGFLGQIYGMAVLPELLTMTAQMETTTGPVKTRAHLAATVEGGLLFAALLAVYPHMAFLGARMILAIVVGASLLRTGSAVWRGSMWSATTLLLGFAMASVVLWSRTAMAVRRTFLLGSFPAGWGLSRPNVIQIAGFQLYPAEVPFPPSTATRGLNGVGWRVAILTGLLLLIVVLVVRQLLRSQDDLRSSQLSWCVAVLAVPLLSCDVFYTYFGPGYQQWKWLAFWQPLVVAAGLCLVVGLIIQEARLLWPGARCLVTVLPWSVLVGVFVLTLSPGPSAHPLQVGRALSALDSRPDLRLARVLNLEARGTQPFWTGMWAAFYLPDRKLRIITPSYFAQNGADVRSPTIILTAAGSVRVLPPRTRP